MTLLFLKTVVKIKKINYPKDGFITKNNKR